MARNRSGWRGRSGCGRRCARTSSAARRRHAGASGRKTRKLTNPRRRRNVPRAPGIAEGMGRPLPTFAAIDRRVVVPQKPRPLGRSGDDMDRIRIVGGRPLNGTIPISGAKNATLPLMIASLLTEDTLVLDNVPRLADVALLQRILSNHAV